MKRKLYLLLFILIVQFMFPSCTAPVKGYSSFPSITQYPQYPTVTKTPFLPEDFKPTETSLPEHLKQENSVWIHPAMPEFIRKTIADMNTIEIIDTKELAEVSISFEEGNIIGNIIYCPVIPFSSLREGITFEELLNQWHGNSMINEGLPILVDQPTYDLFQQVWGTPSENTVQIYLTEELLDKSWQLDAIALIPFEQLQPRWKILKIDGQSPISKSFSIEQYPLNISITSNLNIDNLTGWQFTSKDFTNFNPDLLVDIMLTGVTALVRATAYTMENNGILYPADEIGALLASADITHISNEVSFTENCPDPDPVQRGVQFCSKLSYFDLLPEIGVDVIELSGDHLSDYGSEPFLLTLDLYDQHGFQYYAGGRNYREGIQPLIIEIKGQSIAFIGCNAKGGSFAPATNTVPGAVFCDFENIANQIQELKTQGIPTIVTLQHFEYYTYSAMPAQIRDFEFLAEAGAVIISGSQAHHPKGFEFYQGAYIHYGLGNLFFDQYDISLGTRQGTIDRHIFYNGKHISTEIIPTLLIDYAQPRLMTQEENEAFLQTLFSVSLWKTY